ncbi:hypothetical protein EW145_g5246 [Phellinidium pouzarii]|uniref:Major facilitator superfamily (MFS) profile domain-containing protein n=1 Tax=Phellinidium pouzarii TaxID=167371 RepID=A0A4S4L0P0_9AGAM|nr:hypothetical protein EW145_g5246 [Phellinidium pouzarii]
MASPQSSSFSTYGLFTLVWVLLFAFQYGFHISALNQISDVLTCQTPPGSANHIYDYLFLPSCIVMTHAEFSAVTASFTIGGLLGSLFGTSLTDRRGRRGALIVNGIFLAVGGGCMALAPGISLLLLGRMLIGLGVGIGVCVGPVFLGELAPPTSKGSVGVLFQLAIVFGILSTQLVGMALAEPWLWRFVLLSSSTLAVLQLGISVGVPESPAWLSGNGRAEEAQRVRDNLWVGGGGTAYGSISRGPDRDDSDDELEDPLYADMPEGPVFTSQTTKSISMLQLLRAPEMRVPLLVMIFAMAAQQFSGINAVLYYSNAILGKTLPSFAPYVSLGSTVVNAVMTFPPIFLIERMGRKYLLNISIIGGLVSLLAVGYGLDTGRKVLASVAIISFVASFACGLGPNYLAYLTQAVAALSSAALSLNWIANFIVGSVFLPLRDFLAWGDPLREGRVFYVFASLLVLFGIALNIVYREHREHR